MGIYKIDRTNFAGIIFPGDYDKKLYMSDIAKRIASDNQFNISNRRILKRKMMFEAMKENQEEC